MAKDGTLRGGARIGAGQKKKPLVDKILDGQIEGEVLPAPNYLEVDEEIPPPKDYLSALQKDGEKLYSEQIYKETWQWLKAHGCENLIPQNLLEQYAQVSGRYIYCENLMSRHGLLARHPTTGEAMASPFCRMALDFLKQSQNLWYQIFNVVKEHSAVDYSGANPQNNTMEKLLSIVK